MAEGGGEGPKASDIKSPEARPNRESVVRAFNTAFTKFEEAKTKGELKDPKQVWAVDSINAALGKTDLEKGTDTFENEFAGNKQQEGIPTEELLKFLGEKMDSLPDGEEKKNLQETFAILNTNSKEYGSLHDTTEPKRSERIRQEAHFIYSDSRKTGSALGDWDKAVTTITNRRELVLPVDTVPVDDSKKDTPKPGKTVPTEPEDVKKTEPAPTPAKTVEDVMRTIAIGNGNMRIWKSAREDAELKLRAEQRKGKWWNPFSWTKRVLEEGYRQKYIQQATEAKLTSGNALATTDFAKKATIQPNNKIAEERTETQKVVERIKLGETIANERIIEIKKGTLKDSILNDILRPYIEGKDSALTKGKITNQADVQKALKEFVKTHEKDKDIEEVFGKDKDLGGKLAEYFATDLLETGELIKQDIVAHKYSLDKLDEHINIRLANTRWAAETEANLTGLDKFVAKLQKNGITGWGSNPVVLGFGFSLGTFIAMRLPGGAIRAAAPVTAPVVGSLVGAGFAAVKRNADLKRDMASHKVERAYNMQIPKGAGRREALEHYTYETASVGQLLNGSKDRLAVGGDSRGLSELLSLQLKSEDPNEMVNVLKNREAVLRRVAEIKTRLDFSSQEKVDLVTFDSREKVEHGRLELLKGVVEARLALKKSGMSEVDLDKMEQNFRGEWKQRFTKDKDQQDRNFRNYRMMEAAKSGALAAAIGGLTSVVSQEAIAQVSNRLPLSEVPVIGGMFHRKGETMLEWVAEKTGIESDLHNAGLDIRADVPLANRVTKTMLHDLFENPKSLPIDKNLVLHVDGNDNPYNASFGELTKYADAASGKMANPLPTPPLRLDNGSIIMSGTEDTRNHLPDPLKELFKNWKVEENVTVDDRYNIQHKLAEVFGAGKKAGFAHGNLEFAYGDLGAPGVDNPNHSISIRLLQDHLENQNIRYDQSAGDALFGRVKPEFEDLRKYAIELHGVVDNTPNGPVIHIDPTDSSNLDAFTKADPDGTKFSDVITRELLKDQWGKNGIIGLPTQEWTPPPAIRLTPQDIFEDETPSITLPISPRYPLEALEPYMIQSSIYGGALDSDRKKLFEKQKSPTLLKNPDAVLDPYEEAKKYFERQKPEYTKEIKALEETIGAPPSPNSRATICIPVAGHQEEKNIYEALKNYTYQDAPKDNYEILLFVNYPEVDKAGKPITPDGTMSEIQRFIKDNPDMPVRVVQKVMPFDQANIGTVRKYLNDIALYRQMKRGKDAGDIILVSNDADNKGIAPTYISNFIKKFDENKGVDAMLAQLDWDPESYTQFPLVHIGTRLFQYLNVIGRHHSGRMVSSGANSAFKGSIYAGIGGYIPGIAGEDIAIGQAIIEARGRHEVLGFAGANVSRLYTSSRRAIDALKSGLVPVLQWNKGFSAFDDEIRRMELGTEKTINYDDPKQVEKLKSELEVVIDKTLDTYEEGEKIGKEARYYKQAMRYLGIQYEVKEGRISITNMDMLTGRLKQYQKMGTLLRDIKSGKGTPEMEAELKRLNEEYQDTLETKAAEKKHIQEKLRKEVDIRLEKFDKFPVVLPDVPELPYVIDKLREEKNIEVEGDLVLCLDTRLGSGEMGHIVAGYNNKTGDILAFKRVKKSELADLSRLNHYPSGITDAEQVINAKIKNPALGTFIEEVDKGDTVIKVYPMKSLDLHHYLEKEGNVASSEGTALTIKILEGLRDLHKENILHLDINPNNIMLDKDGATLIDFNAATIKGTDGRYIRGFIGGNRWARPPEMFKENPTINETADTYQAAILLYRLLAGKYPYNPSGGTEEERTEQLRIAHESGKFEIPDTIPDSIQIILRKGIQPDPTKRYQSADEMLNDLLNAYDKLSP